MRKRRGFFLAVSFTLLVTFASTSAIPSAFALKQPAPTEGTGLEEVEEGLLNPGDWSEPLPATGSGLETFLIGHASPVTGIVFGRDAGRVVSLGRENDGMKGWDVGAQAEIQKFIQPNLPPAQTIAAPPGGGFFAVGGKGFIALYNSKTGRQVDSDDFSSDYTIERMAISRSGDRLVALERGIGRTSKRLTFWRVQGGSDLESDFSAPSYPRDFALDSDGKRIAVLSENGRIDLYGIQMPNRRLKQFPLPELQIPEASRIVFNPNNDQFLVGTRDGNLLRVGIATGTQTEIAPYPDTDGFGPIQDLALSPDGRFLAVTGVDRIQLVNLVSDLPRAVESFQTPFSWTDASQAVFSPDGRSLAYRGANPDQAIVVRDISKITGLEEKGTGLFDSRSARSRLSLDQVNKEATRLKLIGYQIFDARRPDHLLQKVELRTGQDSGPVREQVRGLNSRLNPEIIAYDLEEEPGRRARVYIHPDKAAPFGVETRRDPIANPLLRVENRDRPKDSSLPTLAVVVMGVGPRPYRSFENYLVRVPPVDSEPILLKTTYHSISEGRFSPQGDKLILREAETGQTTVYDLSPITSGGQPKQMYYNSIAGRGQEVGFDPAGTALYVYDPQRRKNVVSVALSAAVGLEELGEGGTVYADGLDAWLDLVEAEIDTVTIRVFKHGNTRLGGGKLTIEAVRQAAESILAKYGQFIYMHNHALLELETPGPVIGGLTPPSSPDVPVAAPAPSAAQPPAPALTAVAVAPAGLLAINSTPDTYTSFQTFLMTETYGKGVAVQLGSYQTAVQQLSAKGSASGARGAVLFHRIALPTNVPVTDADNLKDFQSFNLFLPWGLVREIRALKGVDFPVSILIEVAEPNQEKAQKILTRLQQIEESVLAYFGTNASETRISAYLREPTGAIPSAQARAVLDPLREAAAGLPIPTRKVPVVLAYDGVSGQALQQVLQKRGLADVAVVVVSEYPAQARRFEEMGVENQIALVWGNWTEQQYRAAGVQKISRFIPVDPAKPHSWRERVENVVVAAGSYSNILVIRTPEEVFTLLDQLNRLLSSDIGIPEMLEEYQAAVDTLAELL